MPVAGAQESPLVLTIAPAPRLPSFLSFITNKLPKTANGQARISQPMSPVMEQKQFLSPLLVPLEILKETTNTR